MLVRGMVNFRAPAVVALLALLSGHSLHSQVAARKALIIGNSRYKGEGFASLKGVPVRDADAIFRVLLDVGFERDNITVADDLDKESFTNSLIAFRNRLGPKDSAFFYFSGHGFSLDNEDYLAPIDLTMDATKKAVRQNAIPLTEIVSFLIGAQFRVIILDACRTELPLLKTGTTNLSISGLTV